MDEFTIREARPTDEAAALMICLKTGHNGQDATALFLDDPDALGRIYAAPYLKFEPEFALMLEDAAGVCGYVFGALDSRTFYARYEAEWRPELVRRFPAPTGDRTKWARTQQVHEVYHRPEYFCPEPYAEYPSHLHIDLLPRAQGKGFGRRMIEELLTRLKRRGSPGVHLGVSTRNAPAMAFYRKIGFSDLVLVRDDAVLYMGKRL